MKTQGWESPSLAYVADRGLRLDLLPRPGLVGRYPIKMINRSFFIAVVLAARAPPGEADLNLISLRPILTLPTTAGTRVRLSAA